MGLCTALGLEALLEREEFLAAERDLGDLQRRWRPEIAACFEREPAAEGLERLRALGVPCPALTRQQVFEEPQLAESGAIVDIDHRDAGAIRIAGIPIRLSEAPGAVRLPAPPLGQDTDTVLRELGYSTERVAALRERGVVA